MILVDVSFEPFVVHKLICILIESCWQNGMIRTMMNNVLNGHLICINSVESAMFYVKSPVKLNNKFIKSSDALWMPLVVIRTDSRWMWLWMYAFESFDTFSWLSCVIAVCFSFNPFRIIVHILCSQITVLFLCLVFGVVIFFECSMFRCFAWLPFRMLFIIFEWISDKFSFHFTKGYFPTSMQLKYPSNWNSNTFWHIFIFGFFCLFLGISQLLFFSRKERVSTAFRTWINTAKQKKHFSSWRKEIMNGSLYHCWAWLNIKHWTQVMRFEIFVLSRYNFTETSKENE